MTFMIVNSKTKEVKEIDNIAEYIEAQEAEIKRLREALKTKDIFLRKASHEFRAIGMYYLASEAMEVNLYLETQAALKGE